LSKSLFSCTDPVSVLALLSSKSPAILFGHADPDGYLATEQTRTNLKAVGVRVTKMVVSDQTANYRFWEGKFATTNFSRYGLVVTVDIAFSFRSPGVSLAALIQAADANPGTHFVVVDHHPLLRPPMTYSNLSLIEVDTAYRCCLGEPSDDLMAVAAICEGELIRGRRTPLREKRALGVRRAAADVQGIAGLRLLKILEERNWAFFEALADEPREYHHTARGRRTAKSLSSPILQHALALSDSVDPRPLLAQ
jgi:hypothetical protein